jgi:prepilin-type N-terminal cleavage/methylation domain-containing protein
MRRHAGGFTLIELLVVISIMGVLVGLLLPAINAAREAGRRNQCQSNMRQIGLGLLGFMNVNGSFPAAGVISDDPLKQNPGTRPIFVPRNQGIVSWHDPDCTPDSREVPMYNWVVEILAFIDNQSLADAWNKTGPSGVALAYFDDTTWTAGQISNHRISSTSIGILRCPDDVNTQSGEGNLSYVVNGGFSLWHALPIGWIGGAADGQPHPTSYDYSGLRLSSPELGWQGNVTIGRSWV